MKLILFLCCMLAITTQLQAQKTFSTAAQYNDYIVDEQLKIGESLKEFISVFTNSTDSVEIHKARMRIVARADSSVNNVKIMTPFKGDTALKANATRLFSFYSRIAANEYRQLVSLSFSSKKSNEEISKETNEIVKKITDKEAVFDKSFQDAQKAFAAKHNIDLKENEFKLDQ